MGSPGVAGPCCCVLKTRPATPGHQHRFFSDWMIARALTPVDAAAQWTVLGIPWVSFVIIAVEFCERFVFYGMMTQLLLYLEADWGMSDSVAASHVLLFVSTAYFTPLLGGYLADSFFGKHTVIVLFSIVYTLGLFALSLGAFVVRVWPAVAWTLTWSGLLGIAFGTGGIKPCVSTLGACQIDALRGKTEAEADEAMQSYFRWFYWYRPPSQCAVRPVQEHPLRGGRRAALSVPCPMSESALGSSLHRALCTLIMAMGRWRWVGGHTSRPPPPPPGGGGVGGSEPEKKFVCLTSASNFRPLS